MKTKVDLLSNVDMIMCMMASVLLILCMFEGGDAGYAVAKVRKLPKLHRAVWKCKVEKVMKVTKKMKIKKLNTYDKHQRSAYRMMD